MSYDSYYASYSYYSVLFIIISYYAYNVLLFHSMLKKFTVVFLCIVFLIMSYCFV